MKIEDVVVGELVRVREWDEISEEACENGGYEEEDCIYINTDKCFFVDSMRYLCGQIFRIEDITFVDDFDGRVPKVVLSQNDDLLENWVITPGMIELVTTKEQYEVATEELLSILFE